MIECPFKVYVHLIFNIFNANFFASTIQTMCQIALLSNIFSTVQTSLQENQQNGVLLLMSHCDMGR